MRLISDGTDGVIVSWEDEREGGNNRHVYAQRVSSTGSVQWTNNGVAISVASGLKSFSQILPFGTGDAIITWGDERIGGSDNRNIFAQQLNGNGQLGIVTNVEYEQPAVTDFVLQQNYPNPFNPSTKISWQSPSGSHQLLKIYDALGNEVATLIDEYIPAGSYEIEFDAKNLSSGIYFYRLQADGFAETKKMTILR
ncbi:MAG: T9SS type A sorting domain-containing protein [Ignavibacterium sp.]|nr:T9SS type A sorting domain-containing protein [Ignavibacterium sp.]